METYPLSLTDHPVLILDGACGTNLQELHLPDSVWAGAEGCTEILNVTAPEAIQGLHRAFVDAGAMVLETNSFGANRIVLGEYDMADRVVEINRLSVEHARAAIGDQPDCYVAGSVGPTTKLPSLGHISRDDMATAYAEQFQALAEAGVDLFIIETCQDLLQTKTALVTCYEVQEELGLEIPVIISVTIERTGTMLLGTDIAAVVATFEPFPLLALGLNCATGPADMHSHIRYLSNNWPSRISCIPNQGLPEVVNGQTVYPLSPEEYAERMAAFIENDGVSVVGGCCGTTPAHTRALAERLRGAVPGQRHVEAQPRLASLYQTVDLEQDIKPLLIGERCNANGSRKFRDLLLADDWEACLRIAVEQEQAGAHVIDLCTAYVGRDEEHDLTTLLPLVAKSVKVPLMIDSTTPACIEACLKLYPGRCIVNSINLEDGGANLRRIVPMVRKYGASVVALTINEDGMAMTVEDKVATAKEIHRLAVEEGGLRPQDLLFDALTFTIASGDETLRDAAARTLTAMGRIKSELPGVFTVLGLSNVSFGLPTGARRLLNSVFLHEAVEAGMDGAIVSAGKILPLTRIPQDARELCMDLVYDRVREDGKTPLMALIAHFQEASEVEDDEEEKGFELPETTLFRKVVDGDKEELEDVLRMLLLRRSALSVINDILVPAMRQVGELFGAGELLLPFVLMSAEVMKTAVSQLEPFMPRQDEGGRTKVLLATVQGDVHDIGKNLVEIILANNGYHVVNLGIKMPAEAIIEKAREHQVDVIGLSGLLVKSALVMRDNMSIFKEAGLNIPVLLGGAALTKRFVAEDCAPFYDAPVVYCPDAFSGLAAVRAFEAGTLASTVWEGEGKAKARPGRKEARVSRDNPVPEAPFLGARHVVDIDPLVLLPYMNVQALFRGRWGYRRGKLSAAEYAELTETKVQPIYDRLVDLSVREKLVTPRVAYGYYRCFSRGDSVFVAKEGGELVEFDFPRQANDPNLCIADYFKSEAEGGDIISFFVVTIGDRLGQESGKLYEADAYHDYLMMHGFGVEITDALAEYWHDVMRQEMGIDSKAPDEQLGYVVQDYQGSRYGFGYPSCPDLGAHQLIFDLLRPEDIGVSLTENMQMVPEQTTSAMIAHHPQAKYFAV